VKKRESGTIVTTTTTTGTMRCAMESPSMAPVHEAVRQLTKAHALHQDACLRYQKYPDDATALAYLNTAKDLRKAMDAVVATEEPSFYGAWLATWKDDGPAGRDQPPPRPASRGRKKAAARR